MYCTNCDAHNAVGAQECWRCKGRSFSQPTRRDLRDRWEQRRAELRARTQQARGAYETERTGELFGAVFGASTQAVADNARSRFQARVERRLRANVPQEVEDAVGTAQSVTDLSLYGSPNVETAWRRGGRFASGDDRRKAVELYEARRRQLATQRVLRRDWEQALRMNAARAPDAESEAEPDAEAEAGTQAGGTPLRKDRPAGSKQCAACGHMNTREEASKGVCARCGAPLTEEDKQGSRRSLRGFLGGFLRSRARGAAAGASIGGAAGIALGGLLGTATDAVGDLLETALHSLGQTGQAAQRVGRAVCDTIISGIRAVATVGGAAVGAALGLILGPAVMAALGAVMGMLGAAVGLVAGALGRLFGEALKATKQLLDDVTGAALEFSDAIMRIHWMSGQAVGSATQLVFALDAMGVKAGETAGIFGQWGMRAEFLDAKLGALGARLVQNRDGTTNWAQTLLLLRQRFLELPDMLRMPMLSAAVGSSAAQTLYGKFMLPDQQFEAALGRGEEGRRYSEMAERTKLVLEPILQRVRQIASLIKLDIVTAALPAMVALLGRVEQLWEANRERIRQFAQAIPQLILTGLDLMLQGFQKGLELLPTWVEYLKTIAEVLREAGNALIRVLNWADRALFSGKGGVPLIPELPWQKAEREQQQGRYPGRAAGGPVEAGQPYTVGEHGPETFVPNQSGRIVPDDQQRARARELLDEERQYKGEYLKKTIKSIVLAAVAGIGVGTAIAPGIGTLIGAGVGAIAGGAMSLGLSASHELAHRKRLREYERIAEGRPKPSRLPWGAMGVAAGAGALTGARIGAPFGPWGMGIGALLGAAVGALGVAYLAKARTQLTESLKKQFADANPQQAAAGGQGWPDTPIGNWAERQWSGIERLRQEIAQLQAGGGAQVAQGRPPVRIEVALKPTPYFYAEIASLEVGEQYRQIIAATVA